MPLGGITSGTQAVLAYNFGAGNTDRVKGAQKYIFILAAAYTSLLFILARTVGGLFVRLFTSDPTVATEALRAIRIFTLAIIPLAFQYEIVDGFTGLGQVQVALAALILPEGLIFRLPVPAACNVRRGSGILCRTGLRYRRTGRVGDRIYRFNEGDPGKSRGKLI